MKHFKLLMTVILVAMLAAWSMATVQVLQTVPRVDPDRIQRVGQMAFVFSAPEFRRLSSCGATAACTTFLMHIQATRGVPFVSLGGNGYFTAADPAIDLCWEVADSGATVAGIPNANHYVEITAFQPDYIEVMIKADMTLWGASIPTPTQRIKFTLGTPWFVPAGAAGTQFCYISGYAAPNPPYTDPNTQVNTIICANFGAVPDALNEDEFKYEDFWHVGFDVRVHDVGNWSYDTPYQVQFDPSWPAIAQKGQNPGCSMVPGWVCKSDVCWPTLTQWGSAGTVCHVQPTWSYCWTAAGQNPVDPCSGGSAITGITSGIPCTNFVRGSNSWWIKETNCPTGTWMFGTGGTLTITLNSNELSPRWNTTCSAGDFAISGSGSYAMTVYSVTNSVITLKVPAGYIHDPNNVACIAVFLPSISFNVCPLQTKLTTYFVQFTVTVQYTNDYDCSAPPAFTFDVAKARGCVPPTAPATTGKMVLWFPYIPPVKSTGMFCAIAVTNYSDGTTDDGEFDFWTVNGDGFKLAMPALGGHKQYIVNLNDSAIQAAIQPVSTSQADKNFGANHMSGILYYNYTSTTYLLGSPNPPEYGYYAGIDAYAWIIYNDTANGYAARSLDPFWSNATYKPPVWNK